jgi:hypothetical protein
MTKPTWKRTQNNNPVLSFWGLKAIVFPKKNDCYSFSILGVADGPAWGPIFASEAEAHNAAEVAFVEHKDSHDWATPGRQAFEKRLEAENTAPPATSRHGFDPAYFDSHYARLDASRDHETPKAAHFDGCSIKNSSCHSDRCSCWNQGYWVPKSKLFFDQDQKVWYIDRAFAEEHGIDVSEDELED